MNQPKLHYSAPESSLYYLNLQRSILDLSDDRNMNPFSGKTDSAGDRDGGIGGNEYDL